LYSQPLLHFFNNLITHRPFPIDGILEGSKEVEILRQQDVGCMVGEEEQSKFCDHVLCFQACAWSRTVRLKDDFINMYVMLNSPKMLLQGFNLSS